MIKKELWILLPFLLIFLLGLALFLRPHRQAPIIEIVDTFTRQEKTGQRTPHRHTVAYSNVKIELHGVEHIVTVHDNTWNPLKAGDVVEVTKDLSGGIVEYNTKEACRLMLSSAVMGPVCVLLFRAIAKRKKP